MQGLQFLDRQTLYRVGLQLIQREQFSIGVKRAGYISHESAETSIIITGA